MKPPHGLIRYVAKRLEAQQAGLHADARAQQEKLLLRIVDRYRDTVMGREIGLSDVRSLEGFRRHVRVRDGGEYEAMWSRALAANDAGLLHPKPLKYMGLSSGSTGPAKHVPIPKEALDTYRRFTNHLFFHAFHELGVYDLFDGHVLVAAGPPVKEVAQSGVTIGFGSGIAALEAPRFARRLVRPTPEIQVIADRDAKLTRLVDEALPLDVRAISGMPNAATPMLEALLAEARARGHDVRTIRELFPKLALYGYSGMAIDPWADRLRGLLGEGVPLYEVYSSNESPVGYQHHFGEPGLLVDLSVGVFELVPSDAPSSPRIGIADAEPGRLYDLVVTAPGGIFAYALGDRVRLTSKNPYVLEFAGRVREELSLAGEKLGLPTLTAAIARAMAELGHAPRPFVVTESERHGSAVTGYEIFLELDDAPATTAVDALARRIDALLRETHTVYGVMRAGDALIAPLRLVTLPHGTLERALHGERTFGHAKMPPIQRDRAFVGSVRAAADAIRNGARP